MSNFSVQIVLTFFAIVACGYGQKRPSVQLNIKGNAQIEMEYNFVTKALVDAVQRQSKALLFKPLGLQRGHRKSESQNVLRFSYKDCGDPSTDLVTITNLDIQPDPIQIPGNVYVSGTVEIKETLNSPIKGDVEIYTELFGSWVKVPCINNFGTCTYDDLCQYLKEYEDNCPKELIDLGLSCSCPIPSGAWTLDMEEINIDIDLPVSGKVKAIIKLFQGGQQISCSETILEIN